MKISYNIQITFSKILWILLLIAGTFTTMNLKSEAVMLATIGAIVAGITNKQYQDRVKITKGTNNE